MTPMQLVNMALDLAATHPDVELTRNQVGNLAIIDKDGDYIGFVDMRNGSVFILKDNE